MNRHPLTTYSSFGINTELSAVVNGSVQTTKYFLSNYEKIIDNGTVYEINYITAPSGLCAMYVTTNGTGKMYYVYSDHLGSILKVTDHNATTYEQNFDAWGRYRNPDTWEYTGIPVNPVWLHRGFTSHEHLPEFVLINMNGRLYDPVHGMMLNPDKFVQFPSNTANFNRYNYCLFNPLKYTDPNGENFLHWAFGKNSVIGGITAFYWNGFIGIGEVAFHAAVLVSTVAVITVGVMVLSLATIKDDTASGLIGFALALPTGVYLWSKYIFPEAAKITYYIEKHWKIKE